MKKPTKHKPRRADGVMRSSDGKLVNLAGICVELGWRPNLVRRYLKNADCMPHMGQTHET